jgi:hypothetical protein
MQDETKLFIYNHRLDGNQIAIFALAIAEDQDVLGSWDNWDHFLQETGIVNSAPWDLVGGLILDENGIVKFDQATMNVAISKRKLLMSGKDLVFKLKNTFSGLSLLQRSTLLAPMITIFDVIQSDTSFTESDFSDALNIISDIATQTGILPSDQITNLYNELVVWSNNYKFAV